LWQLCGFSCGTWWAAFCLCPRGWSSGQARYGFGGNNPPRTPYTPWRWEPPEPQPRQYSADRRHWSNVCAEPPAGRKPSARSGLTPGEDPARLRYTQPRRPQQLEPAHQHQNNHEKPKVLERVDMAEYAGAYAQSGVAVAKSFIYRTHAVAFKTLPPQTRHRGV